ncbi:MAG: OsmC family protein [Terriglobales bacterium]
MNKTHEYHLTISWIGNRGSGTSAYAAYSRDHIISAAGKSANIAGSSDPSFCGDPQRYSPEELLVAALSACHMLWFLHLCAVSGIVVTEYADDAAGTMVEHPDGSGEFTSVTLHPKVTLNNPGRNNELAHLHAKAHSLCFIARSMNFPVQHDPR